jgi:serine/threonine protein kinase
MTPVMFEAGSQLGSYRLVAPLGAGGMGQVWRAEDTRLGRMVAIKILPPEVASAPDSIGRMKREARTAAQLNHPNIATIHAIEETGGVHFIVMELVDGEPLSALIRRGPIAEADLCRIGKGVAEALAEAHDKGVVHRDIKPDNIMVNGPRVKVLDFGIAKRLQPEAVASNDPTAFLTQQGLIIGTVHYMSPEQALGKALDPRSDLFSLGVVLYQGATGQLPFVGESVTETITRIVRDEAEAPRGVSAGFAGIIRRLLRKAPGDRFGSAHELVHVLDAHLGFAPTAPYTKRTQRVEPRVRPARRWPWIAAPIALVLAAGLGAFVMTRPPRAPGVRPASSQPPVSPAIPATTSVAVVSEPAGETAPPPVETASRLEAGGTREARSADDFYDEGLARIVERQPVAAREAFQAAIELDPQHARSHFRLGEMALFQRDFLTARRELEAALAHADRLEPREHKLTELGLAILDRDRTRAETLFREVAAISPRDPDLMRFRQLFAEPRERPKRGFPRRVRPQR